MSQDVKQRESNSQIVILHLTDLHFGWDGNEKEYADRDLALKGLLQALNALPPEWKPNCVCISGDIGWKGLAGDYVDAEKWIKSLLDLLKLESEALFVCLGNHDVNRNEAKKHGRPSNPKEADEMLGDISSPNHYEMIFRAFIEFCKSFGIPAYSLAKTNTYLMGQRQFRGVNFVSYNSAWFCKGDDDKGKLWIGLPLIKIMESNGQLPNAEQLYEGQPTVALLHHPKEWFAESEIRADENYNRPNTFNYLSCRCHLLLTGHTHGEVRPADRFAESAWHLNGGSSYNGASHFNSFKLIRIESNRFVYRSFEYDPRSSDNKWKPIGEPKRLPFILESTKPTSHLPTITIDDLSKYRDDSILDAKRFIELKSRTIKPSGSLPKPIPRNVVINVKGTRHRFTPNGKLIDEQQRYVVMPFFRAAMQSRRTLLLGDLGTGKSTLAGEFIIKTLDENPQSLGYIVPAKCFKDKTDITLNDLLLTMSKYINEQISPATKGVDIRDLLNNRVEISIIIDGLDEIAIHIAANLLRQLGSLTNHWPNIHVVATSRPVELHGVDYEDWAVLSTISLNNAEKFHLFKEEALANGKNDKEAEEIAIKLLQKLIDDSFLNSLATSPLFVRLLYSKLLVLQSGKTYTLGDLLYELIKERLGGWAKRDLKQTTTPDFDAEYPDEDSRSILFGKLALHASLLNNNISVEGACIYLQEIIGQDGKVNEIVLANQALQFFHNTGIVNLDEDIEFPIQPIFEVLSGCGLVAVWNENSKAVPLLNLHLWRIISFAAAIIRRQGLLEKLRQKLIDFIQKLLVVEYNVPAAGYIISESKDKVCAEVFISSLNDLGHRPLTLSDQYRQSARAIAEALRLAGQVGFDWFFRQYLDPRFPFVEAGSVVPRFVFEQWANLSFDNLTDHEKNCLKSLIKPHVEAGTSQLLDIIPLIALLIPDAFEVADRLWFLGTFLGKDQFSTRAEKLLALEFESRNRELVNKSLLEHVRRGYENSAAVSNLWLKLNRNRRPPKTILKTLVKFCGSHAGYKKTKLNEYIDDCIERIGQQSWRSFLRWCLSDDHSNVAAGAAIQLYQREERSFLLLGKPLLDALHDGGYVQEADQILSRIIYDNRPDSVKWLSNHISMKGRDSHGAPSAWWRMFLENIDCLGKDGPAFLANSIGGIGCFLLARLPLIRQLFRELLTGPNGMDYRKALTEKLDDFNPTVRHGAAMILVVTDPVNESRALEVVVRSRSRNDHGSWHEWEGFCLTLSFGPSVLENLKSKLPTFDSKGEVFALAILRKNRIALDEKQTEKLVQGLSEIGNWVLDPEDPELSAIKSPETYEILIKTMEERIDRIASETAEKLLRFHRDKLSLRQYARCANLAMVPNKWRLGLLNEQIKKIESDTLYANAIKETAGQIVAQGGIRPLLDIIREAIENEKAWEEIVWRLVCDDSNISIRHEENGQWLLDFGRESVKYKEAIGKAAQKFIHDPRVISSRWGEVRQWLAILGDEFGELPEDDLRNILVRGGAIKQSCACAILARLAEVPKEYHRTSRTGDLPTFSDNSDKSEISITEKINKLVELSRQSEALHPDVCAVLEELAFEEPISNDNLEKLLAEGTYGVLISSALSFLYDQPLRPEFLSRLISFSATQRQTQNPCLKRLFHIFTLGHFTSIRESSEAKAKCIEVLDEALATTSANISDITTWLLGLRGHLNPSQIDLVFDHYAKRTQFDDYELGVQLIRWLSSDIDQETSIKLTEAIERGIQTLNYQKWEILEGGSIDAIKFLLFPLAYWKFTNKVTDLSIRVFLRGLKFMFVRTRPETGSECPLSIMMRIEPLLTQAPKHALKKALTQGETIEDSAIKGICHLLGSLVV